MSEKLHRNGHKIEKMQVNVCKMVVPKYDVWSKQHHE